MTSNAPTMRYADFSNTWPSAGKRLFNRSAALDYQGFNVRNKFRTPDLRGRHFCRFLVDDGEFEPEVRAGETGLKLVQLVTEAVDGAGSMC